MRASFELGGEHIPPGARRTVDIPISLLSDHTSMSLTVQAVHGRQPGPVLFISGAVHGDEIIGVEIIRRVAALKGLSRIRGTLLLAPVVNGYGFISTSRYLPDRRDLNRCFPGSASGSLAAQLAHIFMTEIVSRSQYGVDLHSGALHRENLPQIRANLDDPDVAAMARAFGAPVMLNAGLRDGSLRQAAQEIGCGMLLYEAGEALRFDEASIRIGMRGVLNVMRHIGMLPKRKPGERRHEPAQSTSSYWLRAPIGGLMHAMKKLGDRVEKDDPLALIAGPLGEHEEPLLARHAGIIIGMSNLPVVNRGDALFHVARIASEDGGGDMLETFDLDIEDDLLFDDADLK